MDLATLSPHGKAAMSTQTSHDQNKPDHDHRPLITYFVNNEAEQTHAEELTVEAILTQAGFTPVADYRLISENPRREYTSPTETVKVHPNQRFEALHRGPTPTS